MAWLRDLDLAAVASEKALGGLRVLCAIGFPSTLLQHTVRFHRQLHSSTVVWCRQLYTQRLAAGVPIALIESIVDKKKAPAERNLCYWLVYLIKHGATLNLQADELNQLAHHLCCDGIFVQPYEERSPDLRTFILDTIAFNREMDRQLNQLNFPQLFPAPYDSSVATMQMDTEVVTTPQSQPLSPASPASSVRSPPSSPLSGSRHRLSEVFDGSHEQFEQSDDEHDNASSSKRPRTGSFSFALPCQTPQEEAHSVAEFKALDEASSVSTPAPFSFYPFSAPPADPNESWRSFLAGHLSSPEPSPTES